MEKTTEKTVWEMYSEEELSKMKQRGERIPDNVFVCLRPSKDLLELLSEINESIEKERSTAKKEER